MLPQGQFVFIDRGDHKGECGHVITLPLSERSEIYIVQLLSGRGLLIHRSDLTALQETEYMQLVKREAKL